MSITYLPGRGGIDRVRPYALFDVSSDWKLLRNDGRNLLPHRQTLKSLAKISAKSQMMLLTLFTSMTVHMRLQRIRTSKPFVTDFALMLLLRARRDS